MLFGAWPPARYNGAVSTPTEIKAQAIALLVLGRSCREVQRELHQKFPDARIPHFSTIARWLNKVAGKEAIGAQVYWSFVSKRAGEITLKRMDAEADGMSMLDLVKFASTATDIYYNSLERLQRSAAGTW